jgi:hypothetical protein
MAKIENFDAVYKVLNKLRARVLGNAKEVSVIVGYSQSYAIFCT